MCVVVNIFVFLNSVFIRCIFTFTGGLYNSFAPLKFVFFDFIFTYMDIVVNSIVFD